MIYANNIVFKSVDDSFIKLGTESSLPDFSVHKLNTKINPPEKRAATNK